MKAGGNVRAKLLLRAQCLEAIRAFFQQRQVLEVETAAMSSYQDPLIDAISVDNGKSDQSPSLFLHTSPEPLMKRLLAEGSGDIYQLGKVWRRGDRGRRHNSEFTLLEWYRLGWDEQLLMNEVEELLSTIHCRLANAPCQPCRRLRFVEALRRFAGLDLADDFLDEGPIPASLLSAALKREGMEAPSDARADELLGLVVDGMVAPRLPVDRYTLIYDYPPSELALAANRPPPLAAARRFEVWWGDLEIANGFCELTDADDIARLLAQGRGQRAPSRGEKFFIEAHEKGLPPASGIALGVDRLLMAICGSQSIDEVLAFSPKQI